MAQPTFTNGIGDDAASYLAARMEESGGPSGLGERLAYHAVNAYPAAVEGLTRSLSNIVGRGEIEPIVSDPIAPGKGMGAVADFVGGGLLPMGIQLAATGGAGRLLGLGSLAARSPLLGRVASDALSFGTLGAQEDRVTGLEQAAEGAAFGSLAGLPLLSRILPAAALGMWSKAFFDRDGGTPLMEDGSFTRGDVSGVGGALAGIFQRYAPFRVPTPAAVNPWTTASKIPAPSYAVPPVNPWTTATRPGIATVPYVPANALRQRLGYDPLATGNQNLFNFIRGPQANIAAEDSADAIIGALLPRKELHPPQAMIEPVLTGKSAAKSAQVIAPEVVESLAPPLKGKIPKLPEFRRTEGGEVLSDLLAPIARSTIQALAGGAGGAIGAEAAGLDPRVGAALGAGLLTMPSLLRGGVGLAQKLARPIVEQNNVGAVGRVTNFKPAIRLGSGEILSHPSAELHSDLSQMVAARGAGARNAEEGFIDATGKFWDRRSAYDEAMRTDPDFRRLQNAPGYEEGMGHLAGRLDAHEQQLARDIASDLKFPKWKSLIIDRSGKPSGAMREMAHADLLQGKPAQNFLNARVVDDTLYVQGTEAAMTPGQRRFTTQYAEDHGLKIATNDRRPGMQGSTGGLKPLQPKSGLAYPYKDEGGYVLQPLQSAISRATLGALAGGGVGGAIDGQDGFLPGATVGAIALGLGPTLARAVTNSMSKTKTLPLQGTPSKAKSLVNLNRNWSQVVEDASGQALTANATVSQRFLRALDKGFGITMPAIIKETLMKSRGMASHLLDTMDGALTKLSLRFNVDDTTKGIANDFLDGLPGKDENWLRRSLSQTPEMQKYADFLVAGREAVNGLQKMTLDGIGDPKMASIINDSIGKYLTRSYRLFTHPEWMPKPESIEKLMNEIVAKNLSPGSSAADIRTRLEQYVREVKQAKGIYGKGYSSPAGAMISQQVLKERKDLSDAWREFLGEISNPTERLYQTVFKLRPMAEASKYIDDLTKIKEDGWLPHRFGSYAEKDAFENKLLHDINNAPDAATKALAEAKLDKFQTKWKGMQNVENHPKFGSLKSNIVTRNVWDTLATFDSLTDPTRNPLLRSMAGTHNAIKLARTAFNPLTFVRNYITMPMFATIARANPQDMAEAWRIMKDVNHPMRREIMVQGIGNVDQVKTEFFKEFENITGGKYNFGNVDLQNLGMGKYDLDLAEKMGRRGVRNWLDAYRLPDNMVRIGAYLSSKRRFAQELGKNIDDPEVLAKATTYTNRYTMNYDAVAPAIKLGRQIPFVNMFLSYTAEMTRILKNLTQDVIQGTGEAGINHSRAFAAIPLSMLAVLPELWQNASESELDPQAKAEWDRTQKMMPDYARTRYRVGVNKNAQGNFSYFDITPLIASDALNQTVRAIVSGDTDALHKVNPLYGLENTPLLNMITSQVAGKDLRSHREFRGTKDRVATVAREALPPWFPGVGSEAQRFSQAYGETESGDRGLTNAKTGQRLTPADVWLPYWTGVKSGEANPSVLQQRAVSDAKREIANEVAYLNDVLRTDVANEVKQQSIDKARTAIAEIQENLRELVEKP